MYSKSKALEAFHLHLLRRALGSFPEGEVIWGERPDCIVHSEKGTCGIEITRLHKKVCGDEQPLQVQEGESGMLVEEAKKTYETFHMPFVDVNFYPTTHTTFNKTNRGHFAKALANLVSSNLPEDHGWIILDHSYVDTPNFPAEFALISIARADLTQNHWSAAGGGWVQEDFTLELQRAIECKNRLLPNYRPATQQWLLVVIEGLSDSTMFEPSQATINHTYSSTFDRVCLLEGARGRVHTLKIQGAV